MATLGLDDDELKSVEQMVSRLSQLASSIQSLKMDILKSHPLPHP
jgi:mediator of RNA polymerase II transcription subunit 8, fungi type